MEKKNKYKLRVGELVIILVIILILAAIFIPTLIMLANNSGVSKDAELIRNLNTALATSSKMNGGEKHKTMTDALDAASNAGYIVSRINATKTNNEILWDSKNDAFVYYNDRKGDIEYISGTVSKENMLSVKNKDQVYYLWKITDEALSSSDYNYSLYWTGSAEDIPSVLTAGFDVGTTEGVLELNYIQKSDVAQNVVIRSNSEETVVTIDAPKDVVTHYGAAKTVNVIAVAGSSYHEYGAVGLISVTTGRIEIATDSEVVGIHFAAADTDGDGVRETFDSIVISVADGATLPTFYRDDVAIKDGGTLVCKVEIGGDNEFIWLLKQGIYEQIMVSSASDEPETWINTSDASAEAKEVAREIANNLIIGGATVEIDDTTRDIVVEEGKTVDDYVENTGKDVAEVTQIVEISINVKAYVSDYVASKDDLISIIYNNNITSRAALDKAYVFKAFSDEDRAIVEIFFGATENGKAIFTNDIKDFSDPDKISRALKAVEAQSGSAAAARVEALLNAKSNYLTWLADFEVSCDGDIDVGTVALAGYYTAFAENYYDGLWLGFGLSSVDAENVSVPLKAGDKVRLLDTAYNVTGNKDLHMNYAAICGYVKEFSCGLANLTDENTGKTVTVELCLYEVDEDGNETGTRVVCGSYVYTLEQVSEINAAIIGK